MTTLSLQGSSGELGNLDIDDNQSSKPPLQELMQSINAKLGSLRNFMRSQVRKTFSTHLDAVNFTGRAYISSADWIVDFVNGYSDETYNTAVLPYRNSFLSRCFTERMELFESIARQIPFFSRVLNMGSGGDIVPVKSFENAGHEIISTDFDQSVVDILKLRTLNNNAFACDLLNINEILDDGSMDYLIGNSVLAYLRPDKLKTIIQNISKLMNYGGIFTFDLSPNPLYGQLFSGKDSLSTSNELEVDLDLLQEYIERYGKEQGLLAMAQHSDAKIFGIQLGITRTLSELFKEQGFFVSTGLVRLKTKQMGTIPNWTLRVDRDEVRANKALENEEKVETTSEWLTRFLYGSNPGLRLVALDRENSAKIAKQLGINCTKREAPWRVHDFVKEFFRTNQESLNPEIREEIIQTVSPELFHRRLLPYVEERISLPRKSMLPSAVQADQVFHKLKFLGDPRFQSLTNEAVDVLIDNEYTKEQKREKKPAKKVKSLLKKR